MAEKDTVFKQKIKHTGYASFKDLYSFLYEWLNNEGYSISEESYSEKISGDTKNIEIDWKASRKVSDYFKFTIKVGWRVLGLKEVEVQRQGKKIKTNLGNFELKISGILEKDYEDKWENSPFFKFLRGVYDKYIIKSRIDEYGDKLVGNADELVSQCKAYFSLEGKK